MNSPLQCFLKQVTYFLFYTVGFYVVMICLWGDFAPKIFKKNLNYRIASDGHMLTRLQEVKHIQDVDILFLGSSRCYRGFDNRIFKNVGYSSFNLGSTSQSPIQTELLVNRYLKQLNPKIIIYEVNPLVFSLDGVESGVDIIANDINDFNSIQMGLQLNSIKVYNTLIYGFYRDIFNLNKNVNESKIKKIDTYINGGFVQRNVNNKDLNIKLKPKIFEFKEKQLIAFEKILQLIKDSKIKLILIQSPYSKVLYKSNPNIADFDKKMSTYGTYFNFNEIINLDENLCFFDKSHLNQHGVEIFNQAVIEKVLTNQNSISPK